VRKNGFDNFRKNWSNTRGVKGGINMRDSFIGEALTTSMVLAGKSKERFLEDAPDSINLFQSHFDINNIQHNGAV
jgi:hypothetical protein